METMSVRVGGESMSARSVPGVGAPVVLVHGIPGTSRCWDDVAARLAAAAHPVVVPDLLGFGASSRPDAPEALHAEAQSRALGSLLDALGTGAAVLVGHDFGCPVAVTLAHREPDRVAGLVLLAGNTFPDTPVPFPLSLVSAPVIGALAPRVLFSRPSLRLMVRRGCGAGSRPADPDRYLGDRSHDVSVRTIFTSSLRRLFELYRPVQEALGSIGVPCLVGWGDADPFFPVAQGRRTAEAIPGAELRVYEGAGHFLPEEAPADVAADVARVAAGVRR